MDLQDLDAVREEAEESLARSILFGERLEDEAFVVTEEQGQTVLTFPI